MGRPKALLQLGGKTFLDNILEAIAGSAISQVIVVVGHHRKEIEDSAPNASIIYNPDYELGMVTSFQTGIRSLPPGSSGAMLFLVDHPVVEPAVIRTLLDHAAGNRIAVPVFQGRRGHPVLFGKETLAEVLELTASEGPNSVVRKDPARVIEVPVDHPGILVDVDTPADYQKLL